MIQGAVIGGGVGLGLAVVRRADGEREPARAVRLLKSIAEGATAGAAVAVVVLRGRERRAA